MTQKSTPTEIQEQVIALYESHPFPSYAFNSYILI